MIVDVDAEVFSSLPERKNSSPLHKRKKARVLSKRLAALYVKGSSLREH